jgi:signal transduction histidine kinase
MSNAKIPQILVIAGDYDLINQTQQAFQGERISIQRAFSHRDALYALTHNIFDVALVDAAMVDRRSGEITLVALSRFKGDVSLVAIAPNDALFNQAHPVADAVITKMERQIILHTVLDVLRQPEDPDNGKAMRTATLPASSDVTLRRIDEIQTLFALSKSLTEVLDLTEVLNRIVEAARRLTNADEGMILLPDDDAGDLYLRARVGIDVEVARNFRIKTQDTLAGQVFQSGQPILIGAQGPQKVKTEYFVNSLVYVPILLKGKPTGVLGVNNKTKEDKFDTNQQELLINLASYAAVAIENARIHEESLQRARELEMLVEASQVIGSSLSLQETLPNICAQLARILNVNRTEIYHWERSTNHLQTLARFHQTAWRLGQGPVIQLTKQPALKLALDHNRLFWVTVAEEQLAEERQYIEELGAQAMLVIPVCLDDKVFGAIRVFFVDVPDKLPSSDVTQRASNLALEALASILNQKTQIRPQSAFRAVENINRLTEADWSQLSVLVNDGAALVTHLEIGKAVWLAPLYPSIDMSAYAGWLESLQSQSMLDQKSDGKANASGERRLLEATSSRAILVLPLVQRGHTQGFVLFADTERNRVFGKSEIDMSRTLVGQAATALDNAHLYRDLELSLQELKDTQDRLVQTARLSAMGELAAVVAHQINNPLTTIVVDTELMLMDASPDSRQYDTLMAVSRAGKRAAGVAKRLLAIARPDDPDAPSELIDVPDTIVGVLSLVKTHIERDRIRILSNVPETPVPPVRAVRGQLDDVWLNLLLNAHDALMGRANAQIGIDLTYDEHNPEIEVIVWDNGPGIPDEIKNQIFNPFFTTKPVGEGTGLGLHICRQVIERVGGQISVESEPGQGTRFLVYLPVIS